MSLSIKELEKLEVDDTLFECQSGYNLMATILTAPVREGDRLTWTAESKDGAVINYLITDGNEHYGPRLYWEPQYCSFKDGEAHFEIE